MTAYNKKGSIAQSTSEGMNHDHVLREEKRVDCQLERERGPYGPYIHSTGDKRTNEPDHSTEDNRTT
jgi:hypothetical protein